MCRTPCASSRCTTASSSLVTRSSKDWTRTMTATREDVFRPATTADADALTALERDTNLVALAHVFPDVPYPYDEVRERWVRLLADAEVRVEVAGPSGRLEIGRASCRERAE